MAYFSNGSQGMCLDDQCAECRYGTEPCPVNAVQVNYNYEAVNNEVATNILNDLITNSGTCYMFKMFKKDFQLTEGEKAQIDLFDK